MKCLGCSKELEQIPGRRQKLFCGSTCRSKFWYAQNVKGKSSRKTKLTDLTKPTSVLKPQEQANTNYSINTIPESKIAYYDTPEIFIDKINKAETIEELNLIAAQIEKSKFSWDIRQKLQNMGKQVYNEKFKY